VRNAAGLVLCHPGQRAILARAGVSLHGKLILERPLGALRTFTVRQLRSARFTIGWVGRNHSLKRPEFLIETVARFRMTCPEVRVVLIGRGLGPLHTRLSQCNIDCELHDRKLTPISKYPSLYQSLDCLLITSSTEAGPLPLFEALATGVPVVATPVGWAPHFAALAPSFVRLGNNPRQLAEGLVAMWQGAQELFKSRARIAALADSPRLDSWFVDTLQLSRAVLGLHGARPQSTRQRFSDGLSAAMEGIGCRTRRIFYNILPSASKRLTCCPGKSKAK
jgi:glycosyltransferase involved in cell wall biosynthesis